MSHQAAYNQMAKRVPLPDEEEIKEQQENRLLLEEELKHWLNLPKTKEFLTFLAQKELELLNNARNCSRSKLGNENTDKNLQKSIAYREVIDYLITNKKPEKE